MKNSLTLQQIEFCAGECQTQSIRLPNELVMIERI